MASIARGSSSGCSNIVLDVYFQVAGILRDVYVLDFQIWDVSTAEKILSPVQVYPAVEGEWESVDIDNTCPTEGAGHVSTGHYVADYTVPIAEPVGMHRIKWRWQLTETSPQQYFTEEFEVLEVSSASAGDLYCTVQDMRDEGFSSDVYTDAQVVARISRCSRMIDMYTGQFFYPQTLDFQVDGRGGTILQLGLPIIAIELVEFEFSPINPSFVALDEDYMRVYNRHISANLTVPDDRQNPKIELYHLSDDITGDVPFQLAKLIFPRGTQNIRVSGTFGYTDYDGSATGKTPDMIKHACKLMVARELNNLASAADRDETMKRYRVISESTREQSIRYMSLSDVGVSGGFTGDPEIDGILVNYVRQIGMGAV